MASLRPPNISCYNDLIMTLLQPSSAQHCPPCKLGDLAEGTNLHQAIEAGEVAIYAEMLRGMSHDYLSEIDMATRMPDPMLARHLAARHCARTILNGSCPFFTAKVDRNDAVKIAPKLHLAG